MKIAVRALVYAVLIGLVLWTGRGFVAGFRSGAGGRDLTLSDLVSTEAKKTTPLALPSAPEPARTNETQSPNGSTNLPETVTNSPGMTAGATNAEAIPGAAATGGAPTNVVPAIVSATTNEPSVAVPATAAPQAAASPDAPGNSLLAYLGGFVLSMAALGLLAARDFSSFFAEKSLDFLFNDDGKGVRNPELEEAEAVWSAGDKLEAIRLMRAYYEANPREVFVALRIAEIYEQDLGNYLAAALELEEVLLKKLPPDRWGWAALRLCNLYSKLNKIDQATALLRRVAVEHSLTPAAEKARKRLQQVDPEFFASLTVPGIPEADGAEDDESKSSAEPGQSQLPPGFRPKK